MPDTNLTACSERTDDNFPYRLREAWETFHDLWGKARSQGLTITICQGSDPYSIAYVDSVIYSPEKTTCTISKTIKY